MTSHHLPRLSVLALVLTLFVLVPSTPAGAASTYRGPAAPSASIAPNVIVSRDAFQAHSEPDVAENPKNPRNLVAGSKMFSDPAHYLFKIGTYYSLDGGQNWHDSGPLPGFGTYPLTSDVSVAFSRSGIAYVTVLACDGIVCPGNGSRSGVFVSRSSDGGKTFSSPVTVYLDTTGDTFSDKPWIAVDGTTGTTGGTIYVAWNLDPVNSTSSCADPDRGASRETAGLPVATDGGMVVARSIDGGRSFSPPVLVAPFTDTESYIGAIPAVGPTGDVSVVFASLTCSSGTVGSIVMVTSHDGGVTFSPPQPIVRGVVSLPDRLPNSTFRNNTMPTFAVSPRDGSMLVAWADMRSGDADILASRSADGGITWSQPVRVNHDHFKNGKDQFQPVLAVAPNGTYSCAWFDRRRDPGNRLIDEEIAQSVDGGRTFGHNYRVTTTSWDPAIDAPRPDGRSSTTFIGDYQGLAVDNLSVHPLWNDTQNSTTQEIRTATIPIRLFTRR